MYREFETLHVNAQVDIHPDINFWLHEAQGLDEHEKFIYFYHKDHLGSSTQISDIDANIVHHIEYMPYGENFFEKRSLWATRYKFNAKEKDEETGLYYYGARYYSPELSIWTSVDPLSDKYPSMSPFMYCAGNPVKLVDPNGMDIDPTSVTDETKNMKNPSHESYNKAFAEKYKTLENDHNAMYSFNPTDGPVVSEDGSKDYGSVSYNGKNENGQYKIGINYSTNTGTSGLSTSSPLLEETFHSTQFSKGEFGFLSNGSTFGLDIYDEVDAKLFAALNTKDLKFNIENKMIKAYNKNKNIDDVVDFIKNRPSLSRYSNLYGKKENVVQSLERANNNNVRSFFDSNGKSKLPNVIMQLPR